MKCCFSKIPTAFELMKSDAVWAFKSLPHFQGIPVHESSKYFKGAVAE